MVKPKPKAKAKAGARARSAGRAPSKRVGGKPGKPNSKPGKPNNPAELAAELRQALLASIQAKAGKGETVSQHELRFLEAEAARATASQSATWSGRAACAGDLGVSAKTVEKWAASGAPIPARAPIDKAALWKWRFERLQRISGEREPETAEPAPGQEALAGTADSKPELESQLLAAKIRHVDAQADKLEANTQAEAFEEARGALEEILGALRSALLDVLPDDLWALGREHAERRPGSLAIRQRIDAELLRAAAADIGQAMAAAKVEQQEADGEADHG